MYDINRVHRYMKYPVAHASVCVPKSCSTPELESIWNYTEYYFGFNATVLFDERMCTIAEKPPYTLLDKIAM